MGEPPKYRSALTILLARRGGRAVWAGLRSLGRSLEELRWSHGAVMVAIGLGEFGRRLCRPFVERKLSVLVQIELGIGLSTRGQIFLPGHRAVAILVIAAEALLLARPVARFGNRIGKRTVSPGDLLGSGDRTARDC